MKTVIIGSGNVAYHLAKAFTQNNIKVHQIFGRNEIELSNISNEFNIPYSNENLEEAELYIIAVSDSSLENVSELIKNENALVAHTSGSLPKEILKGNYRKASFYPLQTFSKTKVLDYSKIPFFIEAEDQIDEKSLFELASIISENVEVSNYEKRKYIHLTAVFACNFVNHLFARAKEISDSQDLDFNYFLPLINETVEKIYHLDPKLAQTGPAVRGDERVLKLHEESITNEEQLDIYKTLNESIKKMYQ
ncbi:DUF2520 domain-containing protein [Epilithonimonas ginsengisoli]|uniref:DUF2520 domain-containing protein n=1 Tax=Epilithonimonas ginsengisoli TaxID=1245592 RepID=A0ABU4JEM1_9FLAO|nr:MULTISPECIES: DUF2520 domain-containing protein [Chryseobacterium group]MBV6879498.1 DUF2520 domain-containing protein [Epilithonimonas sp. FP105]MDW8548134.1 DUF2520 domain-containing protein [Epilithonimonas ginsengisoli]OAH64429.1 NADP oxidoreductase [Chryseobacterium sp. FP211-J200]